ncbi:MAG: hypothetical protein ACJ746_14130 [Bryobacteraceae bacterium]
MKALKWACVGVLLATVVVSSSVLTPYVSVYEAVMRFAIGLGAIILLFESRRLWRMVLMRRSQRGGVSWERLTVLLDRWIPPPRVLHPYPMERFDATHPRRKRHA